MKQFLTLFLAFTVVHLYAQRPHSYTTSTKVNVKGKVIEKQTGQALEYATLIFTSVKTKKVTGGITDSNGIFNIEVPKGIYNISVEFLSFKTRHFPNQKIFNNTDLGIISLEMDTEALDEVEIIAEKSTVEIRLDKKIYNVGKDMTVTGGNASDVLDNVPSVTVDIEGNVSLRGNESVRILIDGKPSGLVGLNSTDALKQLPAEAIQKVEVITSPSARYDAEGTAGIINIILRKSKAQGLNASTTLTAGSPDYYGAAANVNYRIGKFNIFTNLGYTYRDAPGSGYNKNFDAVTGAIYYEEIRDSDRERNSFNINSGLEYFITKSATIGASILYKNSDGQTNIDNDGYEYDPPETVVLQTFRNELEDIENDVLEYTVNFTKNFKTSGHKLSFDIQLQNSLENQDALITDNNIIPNDGDTVYEHVVNDDDENRILIKSDYVLPIGENQQFEAGFQSTLQDLTSDYRVSINEGTGFELDEDVSSILDLTNNIYAAYVQYGNKFGKISALIGLRMEITDLSVAVVGYDLDFDKNYTEFFPTLNLSYELSDSENFTLGYNRRLRRARSRYLNPFPSRSSTTNRFHGNPNLDPVFSDAVDLGYLKKWQKLTLSTSIYYQHSKNVFQYIHEDSGEVNDDGLPIIITTLVNLSNEDRIGMEFSVNYSPAKWFRLSNSFNFYQFDLEGSYHDIDYSSSDKNWSNRFSSRIKFLKKVDFQTSLQYRGGYENAVSKRSARYYVNMALSKDILKEKGTLSFNVSDLFNSRKYETETYYDTFTNFSVHKWHERQMKLSFTYRFNQKKKQSRRRNGEYEEEFFD